MELTRLLQHGDARVAMADAARAHGKPSAAEDLARDLLELAGIPLSGATPIDGARVTNGVLPGASFTRASASANAMGAR
jgi:hypothetical protein